MKKGVLISTTEHVLSAFIGMGIDNAIVELDNLELPILDGSAHPFVEMIQKAGIRKQRRPRKYLKIRRELEMREGGKFIAVYPAETYSVSYSINFPHPLIGKETLQVELSNGNYLRHIAAARTFGSREDERTMRNMGLIRGASRENCIVLTRDGVENGPLRFADEFVRHKMLDIVGDLSLLGRPLNGHLIAVKPSHAANCEMVRRINLNSSRSSGRQIVGSFPPTVPALHRTACRNLSNLRTSTAPLPDCSDRAPPAPDLPPGPRRAALPAQHRVQ